MNLHSIRALQAVCSSELQLRWQEPPLPPQHQTPPEHSVNPASGCRLISRRQKIGMLILFLYFYFYFRVCKVYSSSLVKQWHVAMKSMLM